MKNQSGVYGIDPVCFGPVNDERNLTNATDATKTGDIKTANAVAAPVIAESQLPQSDREAEHMQGHWVLAKLGKRVLRPGGERLTRRMLEHTPIAGKRVVEFAPGLGRTTRLILNAGPAGYTGVDRDEQVVNIIGPLAASVGGACVRADASQTGLADESTDVVIGEAMLTMQSERGKRAIIGEAHRILKPGGLYAIHEMGLAPDDLNDSVKDSIRKDLAKAIKVNARPLTAAEWRELLESEGFEVLWTGTEPMALLKMRRNLADEGVPGVLRIVRNVLTHPDLRARVMQMRRVFNTYGDALTGIAFVVRRRD
ncbi:methyltransferase [Bifidobacterium callimiconis]|uniref:Methyltransferase n=1 Tax=Bifidobacterium callimiconis TaxID=2306973 RepID=A0A430F635_9BIFI|nr:methyltransferase [Bifidobacterium callimiconis]